MSIVIPGLLVTGTFLIVAVFIFITVLDTGRNQAESILEATDLRGERLATLISIDSVVSGSPITVKVDNIGSATIGKSANMDVILRYMPDGGGPDPVVKRLTYVTGSPSHNESNPEWSIVSISPDTFNPGLWDPGEQAELQLHPVPHVEDQTTPTVVIVTPNGATDSTSFVAT